MGAILEIQNRTDSNVIGVRLEYVGAPGGSGVRADLGQPILPRSGMLLEGLQMAGMARAVCSVDAQGGEVVGPEFEITPETAISIVLQFRPESGFEVSLQDARVLPGEMSQKPWGTPPLRWAKATVGAHSKS